MEEKVNKKRELYRERYGEVRRRKRKKKNISQKELAEELGITAATVSRYEKGTLEIPASSLPLVSEMCRFRFSEYMEGFDIYHISERMAEIEAYGHVSRKAAYPPVNWDVARCKRERLRLIAKIKERIKDISDNDELFCMIQVFDVMHGYDEGKMPEEWRSLKEEVVKRARCLMKNVPGLTDLIFRYDCLTRIVEEQDGGNDSTV